MTAIHSQHTALYLGMVLSSALLVFIALGPGLSSAQINPFSWHYQVFDMLCHQDPERSYSISGIQMAVCSRCLGIYTSFFLAMLLMPLIAFIKKFSKKVEKWLFTSAILINFIDVIGNYFKLWTNTLNSRFLLGVILGLAAALFLTTGFFKQLKSED